MVTDAADDTVERALLVRCSPAHAFAVWTEKTALWWPRGHHPGGENARVEMEPRAGGRLSAVDEQGVAHAMGKVLDWRPPDSLTLEWYLGSSEAMPSRVEITFKAAEEGTLVRVHHAGVELLGEAHWSRTWPRFLEGWSAALASFAENSRAY